MGRLCATAKQVLERPSQWMVPPQTSNIVESFLEQFIKFLKKLDRTQMSKLWFPSVTWRFTMSNCTICYRIIPGMWEDRGYLSGMMPRGRCMLVDLQHSKLQMKKKHWTFCLKVSKRRLSQPHRWTSIVAELIQFTLFTFRASPSSQPVRRSSNPSSISLISQEMKEPRSLKLLKEWKRPTISISPSLS